MGKGVDTTLLNLVRVKNHHHRTIEIYWEEKTQLVQKTGFFCYYYYHFDETKALLQVYFGKKKRKQRYLE